MTVRLMVMLVLLAATAPLRAQDDAAALVARARGYVEEYQQQFSAVLCEERQTQQVTPADGSIRQRRELVAEMAMVKSGSQTLLFRDVIAVDGKPVRNRGERLRTLFLEPRSNSMRQALAIARESARYNIGITRIFDGLMLPLTVLSPSEAGHFRFNLTEQGLEFQESRSPTMIRSGLGRDNIRDMPLHGWVAIEGDTGRLRAATVMASNAALDSTFEVRYEEHPDLKLLVPAAMQQHHRWKGKLRADVLEVSSTYSQFRRFDVTAAVR